MEEGGRVVRREEIKVDLEKMEEGGGVVRREEIKEDLEKMEKGGEWLEGGKRR